MRYARIDSSLSGVTSLSYPFSFSEGHWFVLDVKLHQLENSRWSLTQLKLIRHDTRADSEVSLENATKR